MDIEEYKKRFYDKVKTNADIEWDRIVKLIDGENEKQVEDNKIAYELQKRLVQCCLDFINETGNKEIMRVSFTADCLQESAKHGKWCPCTDSSCELEGADGTISFSI